MGEPEGEGETAAVREESDRSEDESTTRGGFGLSSTGRASSRVVKLTNGTFGPVVVANTKGSEQQARGTGTESTRLAHDGADQSAGGVRTWVLIRSSTDLDKVPTFLAAASNVDGHLPDGADLVERVLVRQPSAHKVAARQLDAHAERPRRVTPERKQQRPQDLERPVRGR